MRVRHASGRLRLGWASALLAVFLVGCDGKSGGADSSSTSNDPRAGARRKEMSDFMKNQPPGGNRAKH